MVGGAVGVLTDTVCQGNQAPDKHENSAIGVLDFARGLMINMARRFVL